MPNISCLTSQNPHLHYILYQQSAGHLKQSHVTNVVQQNTLNSCADASVDATINSETGTDSSCAPRYLCLNLHVLDFVVYADLRSPESLCLRLCIVCETSESCSPYVFWHNLQGCDMPRSTNTIYVSCIGQQQASRGRDCGGTGLTMDILAENLQPEQRNATRATCTHKEGSRQSSKPVTAVHKASSRSRGDYL